jgi:sugar O-acyltransferase (sialic acid O-acetyltransferase NeuD family)
MKVVFLGAANPETGRMIKVIEKVQPNFQVKGFIDNDPEKKGKNFLGYPIFGGFEVVNDLIDDDTYFVNLITRNTKVRYETSKILSQKGCKFTNFIHPSVDCTDVNLGVGNYIQEGVQIQACTTIRDNTSIHMGSLIAHESVIGNSVFISPGACISGIVTIGDGSLIGTNATILPRLKIGKWSTVGAGAVVFKDVPDYCTVLGNPAKLVLKKTIEYENGKIQ